MARIATYLGAGVATLSLAGSAVAQSGAVPVPLQPSSASDVTPRAGAAASAQVGDATGLSAPPANDQNVIGDIIVTATKRAQNLSQIPAAISAVSADLLTRKAIVNLRDINSEVPGLQVSNANAVVQITIRGVGHSIFSPSAENSDALHRDGVYLSRPSAAQGAFFDVNRVEVLRGPQGTLYGRNA